MGSDRVRVQPLGSSKFGYGRVTGVLHTGTDQKTCERYRDLAKKKGLAMETLAAGLSWGCSPTSPDQSTRKQAIQQHADALQRAAWLGAKSMLMVPGAVKIPWNADYAPVPYAQAVKWAKEAAKRLAGVAEQPTGHPRNDADGMPLCRQLGKRQVERR